MRGAPTVRRLPYTESRLLGRRPDAETLALTRRWVAAEVSPISDVRSTAEYRRAMTGVLVADLVRELALEE